MSSNTTFLLIIILVPVIPSYLLFKFLPSSAMVTGPFKGFKINLSGGFGGYFVIFFILVTIRAAFMSTSYERWTVNGQILFPDSPQTIYIDPRYVTLSVPSLRSDAQGDFTLYFLRTSDGAYDYPHMYISFPGYVSQTFWLGPTELNDRHESLPISFDVKQKKIDIGTIKMVKAAATNGASSPQLNPYATQ